MLSYDHSPWLLRLCEFVAVYFAGEIEAHAEEIAKAIQDFRVPKSKLRQATIPSTGARLRHVARGVASHAPDDVPLAVFTLPGVRESFFHSFAIDRGLRTVQGDHGVLTVLADRERRQLGVR